jgi:hypothetical protein
VEQNWHTTPAKLVEQAIEATRMINMAVTDDKGLDSAKIDAKYGHVVEHSISIAPKACSEAISASVSPLIPAILSRS